MNEQVKEYIAKQKSPLREIAAKLRELLLRTFPKINESFKNGVPWYESKFYIGVIKTKVHLGFAINGLSKEEKSLFEGTGKTMRHIKIFSLDEIDEKKIVQLMQLVDKKAVIIE